MRMRSWGRRWASDRRGAIIIYVLILFMTLSLIAAALIRLSVLEQRLTHYEIERQQLFYGADSGIELARALLAGGYRSEGESWSFYLEELRVKLVMNPIEIFEAEDDSYAIAACTSTATMIGISGRTSKLMISAEMKIDDRGELSMQSYYWNP